MNKFIVTFSILSLFSFITTSSAVAAKPLAERLLNVDDPAYNDALSEMQNLGLAAKTKLANELTKIAKTHKVDEARANAVSALGDLSQEVKSVIPTLIAALNDKYAPCRQAAVSAIERSGQRTAQVVSAVTKKLSDQNDVVRAKAMSALGNFGADAKTAVASLKKFLRDKDETVRAIARQSLESIGTPEAKEALKGVAP